MNLFPWHRGSLVLILLVLSLPATLATGINMSIHEGGKIISFYDQYYIYQVNGTLTINNPYNESLYNIEIPVYLSTLDIRSNLSGGDVISPHFIYIHQVPAYDSVSFPYRVVGIATQDLAPGNDTILGYAIQRMDPHVYSSLVGTLMKGPLEDASITHRNARVLTVQLRNPTGMTYDVGKIDVIKTPSMDPNTVLKRWSFGDNLTKIDGYGTYFFDFMDNNATEGEVYWLNTDVFIDQIDIDHSANISRYDENDLFQFQANATLNTTTNNSLSFLADRLFLSKTISSTLMVPGQEVNVTILVNNFESNAVTVNLTDFVPEGFSIVNVIDGAAAGQRVSWQASIPPGTLKRFKYTLRYGDSDLLGVDYFKPAELSFKDKTYYSQTISFVRKYIPEKRVFVQKNVKFLSGNEVQVTLSVQNLGETSLQDVMVKEHLLSSAEFKEISVAPLERGLWKINELNQSKTWSTTYVTDRMSVLNDLPEIFGVPKASVLQTIILSNVISSNFSIVSTSVMEIAGIIILALLTILYFLPANFFSRTRRRQTKDLHLLSRELDSLRSKTGKKEEAERLKAQQLHQQQAPVAPPAARMDSPERAARHEALADAADTIDEMKKKTMQDRH